MHTIYGMKASGNCYKVQLLCAMLDVRHQWVEVDPRLGQTRSDDFLIKNPNGKVPVLEMDNGDFLAESNAILFYLAQNSRHWPADAWQQAQCLQWMFFEQYSHEPYVAVARFIKKFLPADHERQRQIPALLESGNKALRVMETHLSGRDYFVGDAASIADIALYAYTHDAAVAGFQLHDYPSIQSWLQRIRALPGFIPQSE